MMLLMQMIALASVALVSATAGWAQVAATHASSARPDVYLLIGQSNMAGRAPIPDDARAQLDRCLLLDDKEQWIPARNPLNQYSTVRKDLGMQQLGPGYSFARAMLKADPAATIGLVVNARGGTTIDEWAKGERLYAEAVRRAKVAMAKGTLKGILWHQGEGNASDPAYLEKLTRFVADLRADLGTPDVPFVCGEVGGTHLVNQQLMAAAKAIPHCACASAEGLTLFDGLHFDTRSAITLGERYAEAMLRLQQEAKR